MAQPKDLADRIASELRLSSLDAFQVQTRQMPGFRFVDLHRAIDAYCREHFDVNELISTNLYDLATILHGKIQFQNQRLVQRSPERGWPVGPDQESYLPDDQFWLCKPKGRYRGSLVARLRYFQPADLAIIETASDLRAYDSAIGTIVNHSRAYSIYRNQYLSLTFTASVNLDGDEQVGPRLHLNFRHPETVEDADIVLNGEIRELLLRNVADLHLRRERLKAIGVPVRRGVLLYGPPGTGKTFACRYLCGKVTNATRLVVTGNAMTQVASIFAIARLLQPTLLILEDVDLAFPARDLNYLGSALGELLDQMDGLRPFDDINFILTTNSLDRMEGAIRDRPGRVSQCIYIGPPGLELRERYLLRHLRNYDISAVDTHQLAIDSDGATQAFLKEWVHRAVQISSERLDDDSPVALRTDDFLAAFEEMRRYADGTAGRIIGFHSG